MRKLMVYHRNPQGTGKYVPATIFGYLADPAQADYGKHFVTIQGCQEGRWIKLADEESFYWTGGAGYGAKVRRYLTCCVVGVFTYRRCFLHSFLCKVNLYWSSCIDYMLITRMLVSLSSAAGSAQGEDGQMDG
jgi:hypothetical protein